MRENIQIEAIKSTNTLYCKTGRENAYRRAFLDGLGASTRDITWNRKKHCHDCCGSNVPWRHKVGCKGTEGNDKCKELEKEEMEYLKNKGC